MYVLVLQRHRSVTAAGSEHGDRRRGDDRISEGIDRTADTSDIRVTSLEVFVESSRVRD